MNHGGIGYIGENKIVLPIDLLRPLSIYDGSFVEVMYYPRPQKHNLDSESGFADFMITPVARRHWPLTAHFIIRIWHLPGTLQKVAKFLANRGVSILNAECSRSAHRYATWNMTIAFSRIRGDNQFDSSTSEHEGTRNALKSLKSEIVRYFKNDQVLFTDKMDGGLKRPVEGFLIRTNSYFHEDLISRGEESSSDRGKRILNRSLKLHCSDFELTDHESKLKHLLTQVKSQGHGALYPSCVFAEMDTRDMNIRVALIPKKLLPYFWEIRLQYVRLEQKNVKNSAGFLAELTSKIPTSRYNLWRVCNHTCRNVETGEVGEIAIYLEDQEHVSESDSKIQILALFDSIKKYFGNENVFQVVDYSALPITSNRIMHERDEERRKLTAASYDVFISYDGRERKRADRLARGLKRHQIRAHVAHRSLGGGVDWQKEIVTNIKNSQVFILLCTKGAKHRNWVNFECGCALAQDKHIIPLMYETKESDLPYCITKRHKVEAKGWYINKLSKIIQTRIALRHLGY